jgi:hypothetical protein
LFKPSSAVQVRELNGLQSQLQNQIEKFGDNIFKSGTIVEGCNFTFYPNYQFVKLKDKNAAGITADLSLYKNLFAINGDGLTAYITNFQAGFESSDPNLNTIFVNYVNSGNSGNAVFAAGDTLSIVDGHNSIFSVNVVSTGTGFSNTDYLVFSPVIVVNTTSGSFSLSDYVSDLTYSSNAQVVGLFTTTGSNNITMVLSPRTVDLANASVNASAWTFAMQDTIRNAANTATGTIQAVFGIGAAGKIVTDGVGSIIETFMTDRGSGYTTLPYVTVRSIGNPSGIAAANLIPISYYDQIQVASVANPVGNGYAFGVSDGTIYQLGRFLRCNSQIVVVNAYSSTPNNVSVAFNTKETIVNYNIDPTLTDNALGTENYNAPGADRLHLEPVLFVGNTDYVQANTQLLSLVQWNDGNPYQQNPTTIYSTIGDTMAARTYDTSGSFVIDPFLVTSVSVANQQSEGSLYTVAVDPGTAYISGYKIQTTRNFKIDVPKATTTTVTNNYNVSLNYDNYIRIKEVGGLFQFSTGDTVDFYDTAKGFLSNTSLSTSGNTTPQGTKIGTGRIRSMILENGVAGDPGAVYQLFLWNVQMNSGKNFRNVKSVYYNGTNKGIADVVLQLDATTVSNVALIQFPQNDTLIFPTGTESLRNTNNTVYTYRTIDQTVATSNGGILTKNISSNPGEQYPYGANLSSSNLRDLYVVPIANNLVAYTALTGTVSVNTSTANCVGTGTTFITDLRAGDYVQVDYGGGSLEIKQIKTVVNNTLVIVDSNGSFTNTAGHVYRAFPKNVPVPFGSRDGLIANNTGTLLTLDFGMTMAGTTSVNTALGCSIERTGVTSTAKTVNRQQYVLLQLSNNAGSTNGPWCLGVPDVFRLRNVYIGNSSVNTSFTDIGSSFYVDSNNDSDAVYLSYLYLNPKATVSLSSSNYLLVCFDYFNRSASGGYFDTVSYLGTSTASGVAAIDSLALSGLTTQASSWEVPNFFDSSGIEYDLLNCLDFRPAVVNTVSVSSNALTAPLNPPNTVSFGNTSSPTNDKKFPLPDSTLTTTIEQYMGRTDAAVVGPDGNIIIQQGNPNIDPNKRYAPSVSSRDMMLNYIKVPSYPNITVNLSNNVLQVIDTSVHTNGKIGTRLSKHTIYPIVANSQTSVPSQPQVFSMADIGNLERRIQNLEYQAALNNLETSVSNKTIPSSVDPSLNRFKFGFIADDFSTLTNTDTTDPQYSAEIEVLDNTVDTSANGGTPTLATNFCVPSKLRWSLKNEIVLNLPYVDSLLISQPLATVTPDIVQPACEPTIVQNEVIGNSVSFCGQGGYTVRGGVSQIYGLFSGEGDYNNGSNGTIYATVANSAGPCALYFFFENDPIITVYQSKIPFPTTTDTSYLTAYTTPVGYYANGAISSPLKTVDIIPTNYTPPSVTIDSSSAAAMTANDVNFLVSNTVMASVWSPINAATTIKQGQYFDSSNKTAYYLGVGTGTYANPQVSLVNNLQKLGGADVAGAGKITWTHNPQNGNYYKVYINANYHSFWGFMTMMLYPSLSQSLIIDPCGATGGPVAYTGSASASYGRGSTIVPDGTRQFDSVIIKCFGLLPGTKHQLYVNGVLDTNDVKPLGGRFGDDIYSDEMGRAVLIYNLSTTNWASEEIALGLTATPNSSPIILNTGQTFANSFIGDAYNLFEILAPNSRAGVKLSYIPWQSF